MKTDRGRDRQTHRLTWRDTQAGRERDTGRHTDWHRETQAGRQADTQKDTEQHSDWVINRQTWRDPDKRETQTVKDTDRQADTHMERHRYIDGHMERDTDKQTDWKTETKRTSQRQRQSKAQWQKQSYMEKRGWGRHKDTICRQKNRSQTGNPWLGACTTILQHPTSVCQHRPTHQLYVGLQKPEVLVAVTHVVNHVFVQHAQQGFHHSIKCLVSLKQITVSHTTMRSTSSSRTSSCCPAKLKVGVDWEEVGEARKGGRPSLEGKKAESIKK